jgi:uncharacterized protein
MSVSAARYPYQAPIDAYGNGGFRFADMSHRGSILCLPTGIHAWDATDATGLTSADFAAVLALQGQVTFLLLGTGEKQVWPAPSLKRAFMDANMALEPMDTGAAARTYNVLLAEKRPVAAALIAVA